MPRIVSLGEPMVEFCGVGTGSLDEVELFERGWGGDTSNFIVACARLGESTGYVTRVGSDDFGRSFLSLWRSEGVDTSRVVVEEGGRTAVYFISLQQGGGHSFTYYRSGSPASRFSRSDLDRSYLASARAFHTSGITLAISLSMREAAFEALSVAKGSGAMVVFDPNIRLALWSREAAVENVERALRYADVAYPTVEEAEMVTGVKGVEAAGEAVRSLGPRVVVLKMGEKGCYVSTAEDAFHSPSFKVPIVDTSGAGDAFSAAFTTGLLNDLGLRRTAEIANATAALKIGWRGAVKHLPRLPEVEEYLKRNPERGAGMG